jgi:hypothetical protein
LWHGATGVAGECGELGLAYVLTMGTGALIDRKNLIEELGDLEFYIEMVRQNLGVSRDYIHANFIAADLYRSPLASALGSNNTMLFLAINVAGNDILDLAKKVAIYNKSHDGSAMMFALYILDELLDAVYERFDITRNDVLAANIAKLSVRYNGLKYSDQAAQARADKIEAA